MTKIRVIALAVATAMTAAITFVPGTSTAHQRATRDSDFQRVRIHGHPAEHPNWTGPRAHEREAFRAKERRGPRGREDHRCSGEESQRERRSAT